ncbi:predicted protein [Histoplasma capsulatum G186AR]|uniref:Uncharacterized protein n=1 Tax=Ajellomyces capsulatus (strain G186AR / H82 / ATCC MYA-2454 / RMSCC 2432) TaxID=447093 RepID=C0ND91_AJECG|nr:uncharacterized protein HCBG_01087 [Histoplasma capsulatum G186AR]EEH11632.1 predicted protein [Histoplasma capsulatum G186AR]
MAQICVAHAGHWVVKSQRKPAEDVVSRKQSSDDLGASGKIRRGSMMPTQEVYSRGSHLLLERQGYDANSRRSQARGSVYSSQSSNLELSDMGRRLLSAAALSGNMLKRGVIKQEHKKRRGLNQHERMG